MLFGLLPYSLNTNPGLPKYLKGLCKTLIGLNAGKEAVKIFRELQGKIKNDPELAEMQETLMTNKDKPQNSKSEN